MAEEKYLEKLNPYWGNLLKDQKELLERKNCPVVSLDGFVTRYRYPIITRNHIPLSWRYDLDPETNPFFAERIRINSTMNSGAIKWLGKYLNMVRVEDVTRKSFFAIAESPNGIDQFTFWPRPCNIPEINGDETNIYDVRLTQHEDGWIYGVFCSEHKDMDKTHKLNFNLSAFAAAGIIRTKDLINWERLPNIKSDHQQRNAVLHPEFIAGKYAFYTRPQDDFILPGSGGGIGWALVDDITQAEIKEEKIIDRRSYHTIKELKNGEGPAPLKTDKGWLHLAHGVRACASGLRYVLYMYVTSLADPSEVIAEPGGYFLAPLGDERIGDVFNVLFSNGWIVDDDGTIFIYYAASDTRLHVATSTVEKLLDYCFNSPPDGLCSHNSIKQINRLIDKNNNYLERIRG